jgi:hypothetical protein
MMFSCDELEILEYLKSWKGTWVPMLEIARCAGGRRKFRESPNWARGLMARMMEAKLVEVNDRGHYRITVVEDRPVTMEKPKIAGRHKTKKSRQVDDNYFPEDTIEQEPETPKLPVAEVVGEDYFPAAT